MKNKILNNPLKVAAILWMTAAVLFILAEAFTAAGFPGYSYATNYVSDLGVPDIGMFQGRSINSPRHVVMNVTFILQGILYFLGTLIVMKNVTKGPKKWLIALGAIAGIGWILIGTFSGNQVNADNGLIAFHIGGASISIIASTAMMFIAGIKAHDFKLSKWYQVSCFVLVILAIVSAIMLLVDSGSTTINIFDDGIWERGILYSILLWQFLTGYMLIADKKDSLRI